MNTLAKSAICFGASVFAASAIYTPADAAALVMTFDDLPYGGSTYVENGITATALYDIVSSFSPGSLHLDDGGASFTGSVEFSIDGRDFLPNSFEYRGSGTYFCSDSEMLNCGIPFDNARVQGFREGAEFLIFYFRPA